jgi:hypothetical protein
MNITVNVDEVDLNTVIREYGEDGPVTLADLVASQIHAKLMQGGKAYDGIRERVNSIRDEEIREAVKPQIAEALSRPMRQSNLYGEPTGPETTLSALIATEARKLVTKPTDSYSRDNGTYLSQVIAAEVEKAFKAEIADAVKQARDAVTKELGGQIGSAITATVTEALRKR